MRYKNSRAVIEDDGSITNGYSRQDAPLRDETSDVNTAGYRTLAQQIMELEEAGMALRAKREMMYNLSTESLAPKQTYE